MASGSLATFLRRLRRLAARQGTEHLTDRQLLERFTAQHDEAAFAMLVYRHGAFVQGVGRRILHDSHAAEDVLQATFLILARKAASIRKQQSLAGWLYRVAYRLAVQAKAAASQRSLTERQKPSPPQSDPIAELSWRELGAVLDEALHSLPVKLQAPLVLCYLEDKTQDEAARLLGWTKGTLRRRLDRGRELLRGRLERRGVLLSTSLLATALSQGSASATVAAALVDVTVEAALAVAAGEGVAGTISVQAALLAEGVMHAMLLTKIKLTVVAVLTMGLLGVGAGVVTHHALADKPGAVKLSAAPQPPTPVVDRPKTVEQPPRTDRDGDPLPEGALARLGTTRWHAGGMPILLAFLPDGKTLLAVERKAGKIAFIREIATGKALRTFGGHHDDVRNAALSPDARRLVTAGYDRRVKKDTIIVWDAATGKELRRWEERGDAVAFSPDGKTLATSDQGLTIHLRDVETDKVVHLKGAFNDCCLLFSPDGKTLASGSWSENVRLWDVKTGKRLQKINDPFNAFGANTLQAMAFSPDSTILAVIDFTHDAVRLWDLATGKQIRQFERTKPVSVAFSPDGKFLASLGGTASKGSFIDSIRIWEVATGKEVRELRGSLPDPNPNHLFAFVFSADGKTLAGGWQNKIYLWDLASGKDLLPNSSEPPGWVQSVAYSPDGRLLAMGNDDKTISLWEPTTGKLVRRFEQGHTTGVGRVAFSPQGEMLASVGRLDKTIRLWDVATGRVIHQFQGNFQGGLYVAFSPNGRTLVTSGGEQMLRVWEVATGKELRQIAGPNDYLLGAGFSPNGKLLAALSANYGKDEQGERDGAIVVWDAVTGKEQRRWSMAPKPLVVFSPDSQLLVGGENDARPRSKRSRDALVMRDVTVHLWNIATGREHHFLVPRQADISSRALSPDGKSFTLGYSDGSILLCELASGQVRRQWEGHLAAVSDLAFSPDGRTLTSGSVDTTALIWDVTGLAGARRLSAPLSPSQLDALWTALGDPNAAKGYQAIWSLTTAPEQSVPLLQQRLQPAAKVDSQKIDRLIADLNSDRFPVRQQAMKELDELGRNAEPALLQALVNQPTLEVRLRLEQLLDKCATVFEAEPVQLRSLRAVEVLEHIGTPAAHAVLQALAQGAPEAPLTQEAKASRERLAKRPSAIP